MLTIVPVVRNTCDLLPTVQADDTYWCGVGYLGAITRGCHGGAQGFIYCPKRIQPQLLQMSLIVCVKQSIFLYTCVCTGSMRAMNCDVAGWWVHVPFFFGLKACALHINYFSVRMFIVFTASFSISLHSWVPLPAVGSVPLLCCKDGAVGIPWASLHGHRCSQRTSSDGDILYHQVRTPLPSHPDSLVGICEWISEICLKILATKLSAYPDAPRI